MLRWGERRSILLHQAEPCSNVLVVRHSGGDFHGNGSLDYQRSPCVLVATYPDSRHGRQQGEQQGVRAHTPPAAGHGRGPGHVVVAASGLQLARSQEMVAISRTDQSASFSSICSTLGNDKGNLASDDRCVHAGDGSKRLLGESLLTWKCYRWTPASCSFNSVSWPTHLRIRGHH